MSLYHTYRPKTLAGVLGNEAAVSALEEMLGNPAKMPRVWLLHGGTGCGKTTIGRIIKSKLEVADNDFTEINSSEMRGIDTVRELIKNCMFKPMQGAYRMYLIDECHKMTNDAQNAILKLLEDTPSHLIICLCTTEPEKMIKAILGRCMPIQVAPLSDVLMGRLLKKVAKLEKATISEDVLEMIVKGSQGHPRNALNMLEAVLATPEEQRLEVAKRTQETQSQSIELCRALMNGAKWGAIAAILTGLKEQDAESTRRAVLGYCQAVLLKGDNIKAGVIMDYFIEPFYHTGFPQLVHACYSVTKN